MQKSSFGNAQFNKSNKPRPWNPRATVNDRGLCFLVGESTKAPGTYMVLRCDLNQPKDGGVEATVVGVDLTNGAADLLAERLNREAMQ